MKSFELCITHFIYWTVLLLVNLGSDYTVIWEGTLQDESHVIFLHNSKLVISCIFFSLRDVPSS